MPSNACLPTWCYTAVRCCRGSGSEGPSALQAEWRVKGTRKSLNLDLNHYVLTLSWTELIVLMFTTYFLVATIFGGLYIAAASANSKALYSPDNMLVVKPATAIMWYSLNIILSLGYGALLPGTAAVQALTMLEQLVATILNAILIGIIVNKASVPLSKVVYSNVAVVSPRDGVDHFIFRICHGRGYFLLNPEVRIFYFHRVVTSEGESTFIGEPLAYDPPPMMSPIVAIAHKIDENSPLFNMTPERMDEESGHVMICIGAVDNQVQETTYSRHIYKSEDVEWNYRFVDAIDFAGSTPTVDLALLHETVEIGEKEENSSGAGAALEHPKLSKLGTRSVSRGRQGSAKPKRQVNAEVHSTQIFKSTSSYLSQESGKSDT